MTVMQHLRQYFMEFPGLQEHRLDIDCLQSQPESFSIDSVPSESVVQRYLDGSVVKRLLFTISSRMYYSSNLTGQEENLKFFEDLENWVTRNDLLMILPDLGEKRKARSLEVTLSGYPYTVNEDEGLARYQIQFRLIYLQEE